MIVTMGAEPVFVQGSKFGDSGTTALNHGNLRYSQTQTFLSDFSQSKVK